MTTKKTPAARAYGQTKDGRVIDDAVIAQYAAEAERGFTTQQVIRRGRGRPPLGAQAKTGSSVRLDPVQRAQVIAVAKQYGMTASQVVRAALDKYLTSVAAEPDGRSDAAAKVKSSKAGTAKRVKGGTVTGRTTVKSSTASEALKNPKTSGKAGAASALSKRTKAGAAKPSSPKARSSS